MVDEPHKEQAFPERPTPERLGPNGESAPSSEDTPPTLPTRHGPSEPIDSSDYLDSFQPELLPPAPAPGTQAPLPHIGTFYSAEDSGSPGHTRSHEAGFPTIAGYQVLAELGRGGMGVVYKARQLSLNRLVALKVIQTDRLSDEALARFRTEAETLAQVQNPHVVQIFDFGKHHHQPWFSLELVQGGNLAARMRYRRFSVEEAVELVETIARAVHAVHQLGIIHRDLKPANILLTTEGVPKVSDFGLAKYFEDHAQGGSGAHTRSGAIMGTPRYMAPEQASGLSAQVGPATDVHGLGTILYELLTGQTPFGRETPTTTLVQVMTQEPTPPSHWKEDIPRSLESICLKCLQKHPRDRYTSALELAEDLQRYRHGQPVTVRLPGPRKHLVHWVRNHAVLVLLAMASVVLLAGLSWYAWHSRSTPPTSQPVSAPPSAAKINPLRGELSISISSKDGTKKNLKVGEDFGALPVRNGELVHLHAELKEPAYVYLIWFDSEGKPTPLYPGTGTWKVPPDAQQPRTQVHSPPELNRGWPMEGSSGLETALLLVRRTPLAAGFSLRQVLGKLPRAPLRDPRELAIRGFDSEQPTGELHRSQFRKLGAESAKIDEPLLELLERLRPHFEMARAVRFAHKE